MTLAAAHELIAKAATDVDRLRALLESSKAFYRSNPKRSERWAREALKLAKKLNDAEAEARAHLQRGAALFEMSSLSEAAQEFELATALDRPAEFVSPLLERPLLALGRTLAKQGKYTEAFDQLERALKICRLHQRGSEIDILTHIGNTALEQADYPKALDVQFQALTLLDKHDDPLRRSIVFANIGRIYLEIGHLEKARMFFERSEVLKKELSDDAGLASVSYNVGLIAKELGDIPLALSKYREALAYAESVGRRESEAYIHDGIGQIHLEAGDIRAALKSFDDALENLSATQVRTVECSVLIGKGKALLALKKHAAAIRTLHLAAERSAESGLPSIEAEALTALASAYEKHGKLKDAIASFNRLREVNLALNDQQKQRHIVEIAARVEIDKADRERERMERLAKDAESRAVLLQEESQRQTKQLTELALQLIEKNEFLCNLKEEMEPQLRSSKTAKALAQRIDDHIRSDRDWETFENQFNVVHRDFLTKLSSACPGLTPTELKISALIKLNLPSKAIANLFCLSSRTVENHRLSIRRKLGLRGDANLVSFFMAFGGGDNGNG